MNRRKRMKKKKIFISYHRADSKKKDELVSLLVECGYKVNSIDEEHIFDGKHHDEIAQICVDEIKGCDVTVCIIGKETYKRSHVDHEIKASLKGGIGVRKGLIGVMLEERGDSKDDIDFSTFPNRLQDNRKEEFKYVILEQWASVKTKIVEAIEEAIERSLANINIKNNRKLMKLREGKYYDQPFKN